MDIPAFQHTVARPVTFTGIGLHTGAPVTVTLLPADVDAGIAFVRTDCGDAVVPAAWHLVGETTLGTTVVNPAGVSVATIEHLMAALWGAGVDNTRILIDGPEVPILDGSSAPFLDLIQRTGTVAQGAPRRAIQVLKPVEVRDGDAFIRLLPYDGFAIDMEIAFAHPAIATQTLAVDFDDSTFEGAVSEARTFGFAHEVAQLQKMGLARGGSLENAIVIGESGVLNPEGLRADDEFVRHKILDCVGDLLLARHPLRARVVGYKSGHRLNNLVLRALFADASAWQMVDHSARDTGVFVPAMAERLEAVAAR